MLQRSLKVERYVTDMTVLPTIISIPPRSLHTTGSRSAELSRFLEGHIYTTRYYILDGNPAIRIRGDIGSYQVIR